ncbi:MAG: YHS domain-containing protein [Planctomycetia bacterium]|nr:YHS domain-containing protein [Planctomycetia bacterium]
MKRFLQSVVVLSSVSCVAWCALADDKAKSDKPDADSSTQAAREVIKDALAEFNPLVGGWRGVGQPVRNSNKGSWSETAEWIWELKKDHVGISYAVKEGKQLQSALLTWDPKSKEFELVATLPDSSQRTYRGTNAGNKLTLQSSPDDAGIVHQIVVTQLNEKRTLVLFQVRAKGQQQFNRVAEVGYTREGTKLADEGVGGPECIVTGGKGTMSTVYKGTTYWFCCTGCRDAFMDDPDTIIAQAEAKAAQKKAAAGKKAEKEKS